MTKSSDEIQSITERLTETFVRLVPLNIPPRKASGRAASVDELTGKTAAALSQFYAAARGERERSRLGIIGRARIAFGLQQRLLSAGYPPSLIKQVLFAMLASAFVGKIR
jgi:hypothetical protein